MKKLTPKETGIKWMKWTAIPMSVYLFFSFLPGEIDLIAASILMVLLVLGVAFGAGIVWRVMRD